VGQPDGKSRDVLQESLTEKAGQPDGKSRDVLQESLTEKAGTRCRKA